MACLRWCLDFCVTLSSSDSFGVRDRFRSIFRSTTWSGTAPPPPPPPVEATACETVPAPFAAVRTWDTSLWLLQMKVDVVLTSDSQDIIDSATMEFRFWLSTAALPRPDNCRNESSSKGSSSEAVDLRSMFLRNKLPRFVSLLRVDFTGKLSSRFKFS